MKRLLSSLLALALSFSLVACNESEVNRSSNPPASSTPTNAPTQVPENTPDVQPTPTPVSLSAEGLIQAFLDAGMSVIDATAYTSSTDPNEKLGRPGEYTEKINFNDSNFYDAGETPELSIEVFSKEDDMIKRRDYIQSIVDASGMNAFKYYIYDNGLFLFRIPYKVTPEVAAEYEKIFMDYVQQ